MHEVSYSSWYFDRLFFCRPSWKEVWRRFSDEGGFGISRTVGWGGAPERIHHRISGRLAVRILRWWTFLWWGYLKLKIYTETAYESIDALKEAIRQQMAAIPIKMIQRAVTSDYTNRLRSCVFNNGDHIETYWELFINKDLCKIKAIMDQRVPLWWWEGKGPKSPSPEKRRQTPFQEGRQKNNLSKYPEE